MAPHTILTLVRHGETPANTDGIWHGSTDTPLSERGERQAERVAALAVDAFPDARAVYASTLQRAHRTAQAIAGALSLELRTRPELSEYDLGSWEGRTYRELFEVENFWHHIRRDPDYRPHGGESPRQVTDRLTGALRRIHDDHPGERVVVVTHGGALSMALAEILDGDYTAWRKVMDNCAVSELVLQPVPDLLSYNRTEHLDGL